MTQVLWHNFDVELETHGYNTIKLNFIVTKSKSTSRSGQKRLNFDILKKKYISNAEWPQESNGAISFSVGQIELP